MKRLLLLFLCCFAICHARGESVTAHLVFTQMCDASAGVALDDDLFVAVNDEDNILRFYRLSRPGAPVETCDLNRLLGEKKKPHEFDLEGAARLGDKIFLISSHGRKANGEPAPHRRQFFAVTIDAMGSEVKTKLAGAVYHNLVSDLAADPRLAPFHLAEAAEKAPETRDALNIEALAATPQNTLLIGFRNPIPEGRALIVPMLNPNEVIAGQTPRFGDPLLLDLGGLGLRDIGATTNGYYLLAGPSGDHGQCRLFKWVGPGDKPQLVPEVNFAGIHAEGICFQEATNRNDFLILSDDGSREVDGERCKDLPESQRRFRALRISR